jgi:hypothetical protein
MHLMTRSISAGSTALLAVLSLGLVSAPLPAAAHAILMDSVPAVNATAKGPDITIDLRYNSRIDHKRSRLTLTLPDRSQEVLPIDLNGPDDRLDTKASLKPGAYTLRWQVLAIDGHITRGDVPFTVEGN